MDWFKTIKDFYDEGFYDNVKVAIFVDKNKITPEQYKEITNEAYTA